jgi:GTP-binding protein
VEQEGETVDMLKIASNLPIIAIMGSPNVGKSTLFNRLIGKRKAIVDSIAGVTRDLVGAECKIDNLNCRLIDSGGYVPDAEDALLKEVNKRSMELGKNADLILFLLDVNTITTSDQILLDELRPLTYKVILVVNKIDIPEKENLLWNLYQLGFERVVGISSGHNRNIDLLREEVVRFLEAHCKEKLVYIETETEESVPEDLTLDESAAEELESRLSKEKVMTDVKSFVEDIVEDAMDNIAVDSDEDLSVHILESIPGEDSVGEESDKKAKKMTVIVPSDKIKNITIVIMGKPNTGKSTLSNHLLGEEKSIVSDVPGTTRDVIEGQFNYQNVIFNVLDTAGIRRRSKVIERIEYYSVNRSIASIKSCDVVYLLIDAEEGLTDQDKKIAALAVEEGRGIILVLSKWDLLAAMPNRLEAMRDRIKFFFPVLHFAPILPLSARTGYGIDKLLKMSRHIKRQLESRINTSQLNDAIKEWSAEFPLLTKHKNLRVKYVTQVSTNPIVFVFFVNKVQNVPDNYVRFLENKIRKTFRIENIPLRIEFR